MRTNRTMRTTPSFLALTALLLGACGPRPTSTPEVAAPSPSVGEGEGEGVEEPVASVEPQSADPIDQGWYKEDPDTADGILTLTGASAPVKGLLVDKNGDPWTAGATVVLSGEYIEALFETVGADGRFEIHGLPVGATVGVHASVEPTGDVRTEIAGEENEQSITLTLTCSPSSEEPCPPQLEVGQDENPRQQRESPSVGGADARENPRP